MLGDGGLLPGRSGPGRGALAGSVLLHALLGAVFYLFGIGARPAPPEFEVYRVDIVSPAPPVSAPPEAAVEAPTFEPEPSPLPEPEPEAPPIRQPERTAPEPEAEPETETEQPQQDAPAPADVAAEQQPTEQPAPTRESAEETDAEEAGKDLQVQVSGEEFPYPAYLENIILQIKRYFRWSGPSGLQADIYFEILPDGSVEDIRILRPSGNLQFDFRVRGAVEIAGKRNAFGPLPEGWPGERLPVSFYFRSSQ